MVNPTVQLQRVWSAGHAQVLELPVSRRLPRQARAFVASVLAGHGVSCASTVDAAQLPTSELATRAARQRCGQVVTVEVTVGASTASVSISGDDLPLPIDGEDAQDAAASLAIVEALAADWGTETGRSGRLVWFRLHWSMDTAPPRTAR